MIQKIQAPSVPTAGIAVNKSRMKLYTKAGDLPTYYLQKGQEFQIELFNPTSDVVMAKISLNNTIISQGGLILNPGQRVFLDRYLDVAKKFLFDTYEVSNTSEVKKAIANNGDIKVEFFKEQKPIDYSHLYIPQVYYTNTQPLNWIPSSPIYGNLTGNITTCGSNASFTTSSDANNLVNASSANYSSSIPTMDFMDTSPDLKRSMANRLKTKSLLRSSSPSKDQKIETGRVEKGSYSDQTFKYVDKTFETWAFHIVEYKLLPLSQKVNTVEDINVKVYCTNCGAKLGKTDKFCSSCGTKR